MSDLKKIWEHLNGTQKDMVLYLVYAKPPVSIDALIALSASPATAVLNLVEELRRKKVVCERRGYEKGLYFPVGTQFEEFIEERISENDADRVIKALVDYYARTLDDGREKTLILAELYRKLGDRAEGLSVVKRAADILLQTGDEEKALLYYDCLLEYFKNKEPSGEDVDIFLESVLAKLSASKELRPYHEQIVLLRKAEKVATQYKRWELLARIKLELGSELLVAGETEQGAKNIKDFSNLAQRVNDPLLVKRAALAMAELYFWQGRILDATRCYEEVAGDLEEFGDDEITLRLGVLVAYCYAICGRVARGMGMIDAIRAKGRLLGLHRPVYVADVMKANVFLEVRKIPEAEAALNNSTPPEVPHTIYDHL